MNNSLSYLCYFYYYALRGMLRKQNLQLPTKPVEYTCNFVLSESLQQQWKDLFAVGNVKQPIPFLYYWLEYEKFFLQTMDKLRFKFQNILHLGHEIIFTRDATGVRLDEKVVIKLQVKDIAYLDRDRALIYFESKIEDALEREIIRSIDIVFVRGLSEKNITDLQQSKIFNKTEMSAFLKLSKRKPTLKGDDVRTAEFDVPKNFGSLYGKVSGDRNPMHTCEWVAKKCGFPHAFVQGSATVNFLIKEFIYAQQEKLQNFNIKFCRPIFLGQTVKVNFTQHEFELLDHEGRLVAFGVRKTFCHPATSAG